MSEPEEFRIVEANLDQLSEGEREQIVKQFAVWPSWIRDLFTGQHPNESPFIGYTWFRDCFYTIDDMDEQISLIAFGQSWDGSSQLLLQTDEKMPVTERNAELDRILRELPDVIMEALL